MNLNIRHVFIITIGCSKECKDIITEIYESDEKRYYELYLKSGMYNDLIKNTLPMEDEETVNKLIGIVESCYIDNSFIKIETIIKKLNPSILRFFKTSNIVDVSKFHVKYLNNNNAYEFEESHILANIASLIYLSVIHGKEAIFNEVTEAFLSGLWQRYLDTAIQYEKRNELISFGKNYSEDIKDYYSLFDLEPFEEIKSKSINLFIENLIEERTLSKFPKDIVDKKMIDIDEYQEVRRNLFNEGITKYIGCFSRFINTLGINSDLTFSSVNIDNNVLNIIFKDFVYSKEYNNMDEKDLELYVVSCLYLYNFIEMYKSSKEIYLNRSKEQKYKELIDHESKLKEKEENIQKIIDKNNDILKSKDLEIKKLKEELKLAKEEQKKLKAEKKSLEKDNIELNDELSKINSVKVQEEMDTIELNTGITLEEAINNLKDKKIAIFGGANNIKTIKESLPNVQLFNDLNRDISSIRTADLIVINSDFFSHSFTKKLNSAINKYNLDYKYICGTNIKKIILALNSYII